MLIKQCACGSLEFSGEQVINGIPLIQCAKCGVLHQVVSMTEDELEEFYANGNYHGDHQSKIGSRPYQERYDQDLNVANMRRQAYGLKDGSSVLDVGSGNGAFIEHMSRYGYDAWGVELNKGFAKHPKVYQRPLEELNLPTNHFDTVTVHDVLEHVIDPLSLLREIHRIARKRVIIDFPNYFNPAGKHHWRPIQHLWYPSDNQLRNWFKNTGYEVDCVMQPIDSKLVYYLTPVKERQARILTLPGLGDIYWVMTKMRGLADQLGWGIPLVDVWNFDKRPRALDFVKRIPFVEAGKYREGEVTQPEFKEAVHTAGRVIFPNFEEYDAFVCFDGALSNGKSLTHDILPAILTEWFPPMWQSPLERHLSEAPHDYIVGCFSGYGHFPHWLKHMGAREVASMLDQLAERTKCKIYLTGCWWDKPFNQQIEKHSQSGLVIDRCQNTDLEEFFGLLRGAKGVIGWIGGNTILSGVFLVPTLQIWSRAVFPHESFYENATPQQVVKGIAVEDYTDHALEWLVEMVNHGILLGNTGN